MMALAHSAVAAGAEASGGGFDVVAFVQPASASSCVLNLMVEGVHCGGCVARIERELNRHAGVLAARVNLTTRRLRLEWTGGAERAEAFVRAIESLGFRAMPYDPALLDRSDRASETDLLRAIAVAGFATANIMLLSVAIWAGQFEEMGPATRALMQWFSALVALPAVAYAGRPFFRSALAGLRARRMSMDMPISLAVILASTVSLVEAIHNGPHIYFDAAVTLLFFLLIGRYLDRRARGRARSAAERLLALGAASVTVLDESGQRTQMRAEAVLIGAAVLVAPGERVGVDGRVMSGASEVDTSLITGETIPAGVGPGDLVFAGTINLSGSLRLRVTAVGGGTLLGEIAALMEAAEQRRTRYVELADRVARFYAPAVHGLALGTFLGWLFLSDAAWQTALMYAVTVLIVTCPCALALAVPVVQVVASGRLFRRGILLKSATALERLADVDHVVFDKTGTLTAGHLALITSNGIDPDVMRRAASLAGSSRHPLARALHRACPDAPLAENVRELPGLGLVREGPDGETRLGSRRLCGVTDSSETDGPELWLAEPGQPPIRFGFIDRPRIDAADIVRRLRRRGLGVEILSGDRSSVVGAVAHALEIAQWRGTVTPAEKCARLEALAAEGRCVLMVGDGLNDAPALAAAHVSVSPSTAVDISQTAADAVFQGDRLGPVIELLDVARGAARRVRQNFALAFAYNLLFVPLAIAGAVTPWIAAIAMSTSSLLVIGNALTLARHRPADATP
jgi:Cu2+-exporting ATPase